MELWACKIELVDLIPEPGNAGVVGWSRLRQTELIPSRDGTSSGRFRIWIWKRKFQSKPKAVCWCLLFAPAASSIKGHEPKIFLSNVGFGVYLRFPMSEDKDFHCSSACYALNTSSQVETRAQLPCIPVRFDSNDRYPRGYA